MVCPNDGAAFAKWSNTVWRASSVFARSAHSSAKSCSRISSSIIVVWGEEVTEIEDTSISLELDVDAFGSSLVSLSMVPKKVAKSVGVNTQPCFTLFPMGSNTLHLHYFTTYYTTINMLR